ncbi:MAG: DUF4832 domain-containing protein [Renibacterium sp.]|nr:DUF4832 domain-containing protein [Renibacterium sp.]
MRKRGFHLISGLVVLSVVGLAVWLGVSSVSTLATLEPTGPGEPTGQPSSGTEIVNPMRGQYRWGGTNKWGSFEGQLFPSAGNPGYRAEQQWPGAKISYYRFTWAEVQPGQDDFSFARIEAELAKATTRGEKLGFRIMPADNCCAPMPEPLTVLPGWLTGLGVNQWTYRGFDAAVVVPDWNNPRYLAAMTALIAKLGEKYDGDPRIAFIDMLGYGNFGEWHSYPMNQEYPRNPGGQNEITPANLKALVEANVQAFRRTRLLSFTASPEALAQAMAARSDIGIRMDCLGDATGGSALLNIMANPAATVRWTTAPVVTEWCGANFSQTAEIPAGPNFDFFRADVGQDLYRVGRGQVDRWHVSLLSSGNFPFAYNGGVMAEGQWQDFVAANTMSGYRYSVAAAGVPVRLPGSNRVQVTTTWTNSGVAPTYDAWQIVLELRLKGSPTPIASAVSALDLRTLYWGDGDGGLAPVQGRRTMTDLITIPDSAPAGDYEVVVRVRAAEATAQPDSAGTAKLPGLGLDTAMPQLGNAEYSAGSLAINR